jgi:hypothetical protein
VWRSQSRSCLLYFVGAGQAAKTVNSIAKHLRGQRPRRWSGVLVSSSRRNPMRIRWRLDGLHRQQRFPVALGVITPHRGHGRGGPFVYVLYSRLSAAAPHTTHKAGLMPAHVLLCGRSEPKLTRYTFIQALGPQSDRTTRRALARSVLLRRFFWRVMTHVWRVSSIYVIEQHGIPMLRSTLCVFCDIDVAFFTCGLLRYR